MSKAPTTLLEAVNHFASYENCHEFMMNLRWSDGKVLCPRCGSANVSYLPNAKVFKCYEKHAQQKFSLKVGTIFEDSPLPLQKWLPVMWMLVNAKNGISSWEVHRAVGVTQKTAWFMLQRCRLAMQDELTGGCLGGEVEIDETFIGGKARNMAVAFTFDFKKAKAILLYLASKGLPEFTKGKACKLIFLADKQHLVKHARPITGDWYYAFQHGPIPSRILELLDELELNPKAPEAIELADAFAVDRSFYYPRLRPIQSADLSLLSQSDIETADYIASQFGGMTFTQLRTITHDVPAYEKAWNSKPASSNRESMRFEDFFEEDGEALAGVREEMLENDALRKAFPDPEWF